MWIYGNFDGNLSTSLWWSKTQFNIMKNEEILNRSHEIITSKRKKYYHMMQVNLFKILYKYYNHIPFGLLPSPIAVLFFYQFFRNFILQNNGRGSP